MDDILRNQKNQAELLEMKTTLDGLTADETKEKSLVNLWMEIIQNKAHRGKNWGENEQSISKLQEG